MRNTMNVELEGVNHWDAVQIVKNAMFWHQYAIHECLELPKEYGRIH